MSAKIIDDGGALTIYTDTGLEVWVEPSMGEFEIGVDDHDSVAFLRLTRKELKAFKKAIKRVLREADAS